MTSPDSIDQEVSLDPNKTKLSRLSTPERFQLMFFGLTPELQKKMNPTKEKPFHETPPST